MDTVIWDLFELIQDLAGHVLGGQGGVELGRGDGELIYGTPV